MRNIQSKLSARGRSLRAPAAVALSVFACLAAAPAPAAAPFEAPAEGPVLHVTWAFHADTLAELAGRADLVVLAEHVLTRPGRTAGRGEDAIPFTLNGFRALSTLVGEVEGAVVLVEQTGGARPDGRRLSIHDGGPFRTGERYLLFLQSKGNGLYFQINDQARYRVEEGRLAAVAPGDPVAAALHGRPVERALELVRGAIPDGLPAGR